MNTHPPAVTINDDGDVVFPTAWLTTRAECIVQKARIRLNTFLGEYVLDRFKGVDWLGLRGGKMTDARLETIRAIVVAEIEDMDYVTVVDSSVEKVGREVFVTWSAAIGDDDTEPEVVTATFGLGGGLPDLLTLRNLIMGGRRAS